MRHTNALQTSRTTRPIVLAVLTVLALVTLACGGEEPAVTTATTQAATTTSSAATTSTTSAGSTTTSTVSLPGEPIDLGFFKQGDVLGVVGVAHDDVLNVRAVPGADTQIVATLEPLAADVVALGRSRQLPGSIWTEVEAEGTKGWVNISFIAHLGVVDDVTSQVVQELGEIPEARTMEELGRLVAETLASEEPPSSIVMVTAPTLGDLGEVTYDVIGLGDDAVRGLRLHVFGQPSDDGASFSLKSVESTTLCGRGVTEDGLCL